ncbi:MAG: protein-export chaperone SecB [Holosporales bacterium]|jgi:preprotein translocase subunit SecB|nr:protein-export chaperone SecB [Holosporales bacterium]
MDGRQQNGATAPQSPFHIHDQYVKDLTFENPNFLVKYEKDAPQQDVSVGIEVTVASLGNDNYETMLDLKVKSDVGGEQLFVLELRYAGVVATANNLENDVLEAVLFVHCPFLMFPYARFVVSTIISSGGYPPLMIDPIDFASLYLSKKEQNERGSGKLT